MKMTGGKVNIMMPIEIINRELDCKLFLACMCAQETNRIFVGQHDSIYRLSRHISHGIYIGKHIFLDEWPLAKLDRYNQIKKNGHTLIHLDEEGAIYTGNEERWRERLRQRLDPACLESGDFVCTWGDFQRDFYRSLDPRRGLDILTTGHPRFDLCKPRYRNYYSAEAEKIKDRFGRFILVNTNFSQANNGLGLNDAFSERFGYYTRDARSRLRFINEWAHISHVFVDFIKLINFISIELPDVNIVIRPHPGEDRKYYDTVFKKVKNVHVIHEGSVAPWLLACELLIHDGCTTALEAYMLDTNVINYKTIQNPEHDLVVPNEIGIKCFSKDEVMDEIKNILRSKEKKSSAGLSRLAGTLIDNFSSDSFAKLVSVIRGVESKISRSAHRYNRAGHLVSEYAHRTYANGKKMVRPMFKEKYMAYKFLTGSSTFKGLKRADVNSRIKRIEDILNVKVSCRFYGEELLCIESRDGGPA